MQSRGGNSGGGVKDGLGRRSSSGGNGAQPLRLPDGAGGGTPGCRGIGSASGGGGGAGKLGWLPWQPPWKPASANTSSSCCSSNRTILRL
jgi:hypothetical protein